MVSPIRPRGALSTLPSTPRWTAAVLAIALATGAAAPVSADVLVGIAGPAQGPSLTVGTAIERGAREAIARINAEGGVQGEPVAIVEADDACAADRAEEAARDLVARGVKLVVGHPCASAAIAAARIYADAGILLIAPTLRHTALTEPRAGPTIFRLAGRDDRQGASAGAYLARAFPGKPLAIVSDGSRIAESLVHGALGALKQAGRGEVLTATISGGQKDYAPLVGKLKSAQTAAVFFAGFPIEGGLFLSQMRAAGLDTVFLGSDASANAQLAEAAGAAAAGARALLPHDSAAQVSEQSVRERFALQRPPGALAATYAALEAWRAAASRAHSVDGRPVAQALQQGTFDTVVGPLSFDPNGDARVPSYDVVTWKDGAWRPLE